MHIVGDSAEHRMEVTAHLFANPLRQPGKRTQPSLITSPLECTKDSAEAFSRESLPFHTETARILNLDDMRVNAHQAAENIDEGFG